jgi:light-regulated signal transduction histidine kinase (bacteriophytochrome)
LPIARWIAEKHGGRLVIEPSHYDSTTFCLSLPVVGAA